MPGAVLLCSASASNCSAVMRRSCVLSRVRHRLHLTSHLVAAAVSHSDVDTAVVHGSGKDMLQLLWARVGDVSARERCTSCTKVGMPHRRVLQVVRTPQRLVP